MSRTLRSLAAALRVLVDSLAIRRAALVGHSRSDSTIAAFALAARLCAGFAAAVPGAATREVTGSHCVFFVEPARTADEIDRFLGGR